MSQALTSSSDSRAADHTVTQCFHCGEDLPSKVYYAKINQQQQPMCCIGCQAAAELIQSAGMSDYYQQRDLQSIQRPAQSVDEAHWREFDTANITKQYLSYSDDGNSASALIHVEGIYCSACSWLIERSYQSFTDIEDISVNLSQKRIRIRWKVEETSFSDILLVLAKLGYTPKPLSIYTQNTAAEQIHKQALKRIAVAGLGMMQVMGFAFALYADESQQLMDAATEHFLNLVSLIVTTAVVFYSGAPFFQNALRDLRSRHLGMDVPVALAIGTAYSSSVWNTFIQNGQTVYFDSAVMFIFFLSLGRFMELRIRHKALSSNEALSQLLPPLVTINRNGKTITIPPQELERNDKINLVSGDIIPCDGIIQQGSGRFDESMLTGEAYTLYRQTGDNIIGGSRLENGRITIIVESLGQDSTLAKIGELLDKAQAQRPQQSQLADRIARHFVAAVLCVAFIVGLIWWFIDSSQIFPIVLSVLIVTCPCALSLATPAAITAASHGLSRRGIVLSNSDALETLSKIDHWIFDKTGTLTTGQMGINQVHTLGPLTQEQCFQIASTVEQKSSHPLAKAFSLSSQPKSYTMHAWQEVPGNGVSANIDGYDYYLGRRSWVIGCLGNINSNQQGTGSETQGSEVVLGRMTATATAELLASFSISDTLRDHVKATLKQLAKPCSLLSGDNQNSVANTAEQIGIDDYQAELQPEDKLHALEDMQRQQTVAMVGDGVNDAPVLAQADVSISFSNASQLAQSHADILILNNQISSLATVQSIAQHCQRIIKQNLSWAALYNLSALPLAATGILSPWMAALGMSASSLLVVLNASRLNSNKDTV